MRAWMLLLALAFGAGTGLTYSFDPAVAVGGIAGAAFLIFVSFEYEASRRLARVEEQVHEMRAENAFFQRRP